MSIYEGAGAPGVIPTEDLQSLVGGGLAAEEARLDFRLLGPSETQGRDMQGQRLSTRRCRTMKTWIKNSAVYRLFMQ